MILVDSDVLIAHTRGVTAAGEWLLQARRSTGQLAISVITVAEVVGGMRFSERPQTVRLVATLRKFPVSERVAWRAAELARLYRQTNPGVGLGDYLIAATALLEGLDLATLNVKHFPMFAALKAPF